MKKLEITVYRDSKKIIETEINTGSLRKQVLNFSFMLVSPLILKEIFALFYAAPIFMRYSNYFYKLVDGTITEYEFMVLQDIFNRFGYNFVEFINKLVA